MRWVALAMLVAALDVAAVAQSSMSSAAVAQLIQQPDVKAALEAARAGEPRALDDQVRICEVPAPPFKEAARAELLRQTFMELGLERVRLDSAGNVLGDRPGASAQPRLVVAAHLDTVFPEDTDVSVKRDGRVLRGPGIGDNCRGLAVLVAVVRALRTAVVRTNGPVTFVANVGEEGLGDLRGVKALFAHTLPGQIDRFVSIDGPGLHVTTRAVGSHRYRVTFSGPGGHSFAAFGLPSPVGALGRAVAKINELRVPVDPPTTFNVGRIGGGTSVNAIPEDAWMEIDLRSSDAAALTALDARVQSAIDAAVVEENRRWGASRSGSMVTVKKELVGNRPAGALADSAPIVQTALAVGRALGLRLPIGQGSTDANLPISQNIPAVTIGGGGQGNNAHAATETFDSADSWRGTQNAVLLTIALATR